MEDVNGSRIVASIDEFGAEDVEYATIEGFKKDTKVRIGTLSAYDMVEFGEAKEGTDEKRMAGLDLIRKSLVDADGKRYAVEVPLVDFAKKMNQKTAQRLVKEILALNGLKGKEDEKKDEAEIKND